MKPRFNHEGSGLKRTLVRIGIAMGAFLLLAVPLFPQDYPPGILYVTFQSGAVDSLWEDSMGFILCGIPYIDSVNRANDCQDFRFIGHPALPLSANDYHVIFPDSADIPALAESYKAAPEVRYARPDYYAEPLFTPNDPFFSRHDLGIQCDQWNMDGSHCKFEKAWDVTKGDTGVVIAVIDQGLFYSHPDLRGNLWVNALEDYNGNGTFEPWRSDSTVPGDLNGDDDDGNGFVDDVIGYNFPKGGPPNPYIPIAGHGTIVTSIAAATTNDSIGVSGAAFNCRVMTLSSELIDVDSLLLSALIGAIGYATLMKADVINVSWAISSTLDPGLEKALDSAYAANIVLVAGAGNSSGSHILYPAAYPKVLSVTGTKWDDTKGTIATYNDSVDLSAPIEAWAAYWKGQFQPIYSYHYYPQNWPTPACDTLFVDDTIVINCSYLCPDLDSLTSYNLGQGTSWSSPLVAGAADHSWFEQIPDRIRPKFKKALKIGLDSRDRYSILNTVLKGRGNAQKKFFWRRFRNTSCRVVFYPISDYGTASLSAAIVSEKRSKSKRQLWLDSRWFG